MKVVGGFEIIARIYVFGFGSMLLFPSLALGESWTDWTSKLAESYFGPQSPSLEPSLWPDNDGEVAEPTNVLASEYPKNATTDFPTDAAT